MGMANIYFESLCKAGGEKGPNYNKKHVWVDGKFNGSVRRSCSFCGCWEQTDDKFIRMLEAEYEFYNEHYPPPGGFL